MDVAEGLDRPWLQLGLVARQLAYVNLNIEQAEEVTVVHGHVCRQVGVEQLTQFRPLGAIGDARLVPAVVVAPLVGGGHTLGVLEQEG